MGAAIELRANFDAEMLRKLAKRSRGYSQCRRLIAPVMICDGATRSAAAKVADFGHSDWVLLLNEEVRAGCGTASHGLAR